MIEGPTRKKWSKFDVRTITPITNAQEQMFHQYFQGDNVVAFGSAGTGKTLCALYLAMCDILDPNKPENHLILVRSAVATRDIGFLPGTAVEKQAVYEQPYHDLFTFLFGRTSTYDDMKKAGVVQFMLTSFIRGLTWDNAVVIVDEAENATFHELNSIMTRIGDDSRIILAGDVNQTDLLKSSRDMCGLGKLIEVSKYVDEISTVEFTSDDIVRSGFVKSWIKACERV